jgi:3-oxoacyl-[acyl-carrier protein] reductase
MAAPPGDSHRRCVSRGRLTRSTVDSSVSTAKHAIVTGGVRGIGLATTERLLEQGWSVTVVDVDPGEGGSAPASTVFELDVTDPDGVRRVISRAVLNRGRLDLLVNNAGISRRGPLELLAYEDWMKVIDVDLTGVFLCLQAAGRVMLDQGFATIVNLASVAADRGCPGRGGYSPAKAGVIALTKTAAVEWASRGVRVNAVAPGYVATSWLETPQLDKTEILQRIPMSRFATPSEIADAILFLSSPSAAYITGQVLYVDGGFLADYGVNLVDEPV